MDDSTKLRDEYVTESLTSTKSACSSPPLTSRSSRVNSTVEEKVVALEERMSLKNLGGEHVISSVGVPRASYSHWSGSQDEPFELDCMDLLGPTIHLPQLWLRYHSSSYSGSDSYQESSNSDQENKIPLCCMIPTAASMTRWPRLGGRYSSALLDHHLWGSSHSLSIARTSDLLQVQ